MPRHPNFLNLYIDNYQSHKLTVCNKCMFVIDSNLLDSSFSCSKCEFYHKFVSNLIVCDFCNEYYEEKTPSVDNKHLTGDCSRDLDWCYTCTEMYKIGTTHKCRDSWNLNFTMKGRIRIVKK